jgi:outer membrane protein OmpA-like peptidoglycan-associated protein
MTRILAASAVAAFAFSGITACATKKYVQTTVQDVSGQVRSLSSAMEKTQESTRMNEARIKEVDAAVQSVRQTSQQANQAATEAAARATEAAALAKVVEAKTEAIDEMSRRVVYEVVLSNQDVTFGFDDTDLSDKAQQELSALVETLREEPRNVLIVIEGHTDSIGPTTINKRIGLERAEAVERYLYEKHQIPLPKMDVISYGEERPAAPNTTKAGREQNRRVVIKVMA